MTKLLVGTHDGVFHADEVFAIAILKMVHGEVEISRSRNPTFLTECHIIVDVGGEYNPSKMRFDHHQRGGAGRRGENEVQGEEGHGIPYASAGLVWKHYGLDAVTGNPEVRDAVDNELISVIDANDEGFPICQGKTFGVSAVIRGMNPTWCESGKSPIVPFKEAVELAGKVLRRKIASVAARHAAKSIVLRAIEKAGGDPIIELGTFCPWQEVVCEEAANAKFVVFQIPGQNWRVQCVPLELGSFEKRKPLPATWGGLAGPDLAKTTNVTDATFCHPGLFIAGADSREGAIRMAELALLSE